MKAANFGIKGEDIGLKGAATTFVALHPFSLRLLVQQVRAAGLCHCDKHCD
jgi:hypothetical protein